MTRAEFSDKTKREALARSGGRCEGTGERYGLPAGVRCQRSIGPGRVQYDHWPRPANDPDPETRSLGNCVATCPACNQWAANHTDKQREQSIKNVHYDHELHLARMARKAGLEVADPDKPRGRQGRKSPIRSRKTAWPSRPMPSRKFAKRST